MLGTPLSQPTTIKPGRPMLNPNDLPSNLNLGFGDSASQAAQQPMDLESHAIPSVADLANKPFTSNLENARLLANITKMRVGKLTVEPPTSEPTPQEAKAEYDR